MLDPAFWAGKRVFLTGHTGFKGSWTAHWLASMGAIVGGYSLAPDTSPSLYETTGVAAVCETSWIADIRDGVKLAQTIQDFAPDIVLHYAAQPLVKRGYDEPVDTFETNVMGTINLLEAVRALPSEVICITVTSDKCYENVNNGKALSEDAPMGGADPYSASKGACEIAISAWIRSYFQGDETPVVASVRAGNVIGGGDWADNRLLPDAMRAFAQGQDVIIRNPLATRPWQHVLEPVSGYLMLVERLAADRSLPQHWNFGPRPEDVLPVKNVIDFACDSWSGPAAAKITGTPQDWYEAHTLVLSSDLSQKHLGWAPRLSTQEAVAWTSAWYEAFYNDAATAAQITKRQIADFSALGR